MLPSHSLHGTLLFTTIFNYKIVHHFKMKCVCVCSNANQLHYYALRVPDKWRWVWSIFKSRTTWTDHIMCGTSICIVYCRKLLGWLTVCVVELYCVGWWKEGRRWNPVPAHSLFFSKITNGAATLNVPSWRTNRYQQWLYAFSTYILRMGLEFNPGL